MTFNNIGNRVIYFQAALSSLEREAKENVYAVLDPHIQYEITINKHGEPPKYLSLSKPLTHQRTHAFDPQHIANEISNNDNNENRFSTFKTGPSKARRSNRSSDRKINTFEQSYICKSNNDIEYSKDPFFGIARGIEKESDLNNGRNNEYRSSKTYSRMYERNNSGKRDNVRKENQDKEDNYSKADNRRSSNRRRYEDKNTYKKSANEREKERSFEEFCEDINANEVRDKVEDYKPRPGKVREIASKFNRNSSNVSQPKKERPKPLQSYGNQAYLDHVFPDAVEV